MAPIRPRVIFLIDEYNDQDKNYTLLPNLHLTCLRLLSYYAHNSGIKDTKTAILWGYKFFNSKKQKSRSNYKQHPFLDFTTQNFDTFEKELYRIFQQNHSLGSCDIAMPGDRLKVIFTELLSDFHWERPELFSPGKRSNKSNHEDEVNNFVYMFTRAPNTQEQMLSYFNDKSHINKEKFINLLFTKSLHSKFIRQLKIKLCWIDTLQDRTNVESDVVHSLRSCLNSISGSLICLNQFASWWMYYQEKSNQEVFVDVMNTSSLLHALTTKDLVETNPNVEYLLKIKDSNTSCGIYISSFLKSDTFTTLNNHVKTEIVFTGVMRREDISPRMLQSTGSFHYVLMFDKINSSQNNITIIFKEAREKKEALKICWKPPGSDIECDNSIMIPFTDHIGTIIILKGVAEADVDVDLSDRQESQLSASLEKKLTAWDFGTSLVQCVDHWFLSNPTLGMKAASKNILRKLYKVEIVQSQKREDKSISLLNTLKQSLKPKKENNEDNVVDGDKKPPPIKLTRVKHKKLKGISWVRWRLLEHQKKQKEKLKNSPFFTKEESEKKDMTKSSVSEESLKPLELEEFKLQDDLKKYLESEWHFLQNGTNVRHRYVHRFVMTAIQHFSQIDENKCQELAINFLHKHFKNSVDDIRLNYTKDNLVLQYLLQVQFLLECATAIKHDSTDEQETYVKQIVLFLRSVTFEENSFYVQNHLKSIVIPCFIDRNKSLLQSIYDNLMFEVPECLETSTAESEAEECEKETSPVKLPSSISEYHSDDTSSIGSYQSDRRTLKRIPSIVGENANKRLISVQSKKLKAAATTGKVKSKKKQDRTVKSKEVKRTEEKVVRSLFDATEFQFPSHVPTTPKFKRRHSEILLRNKVPDTPEGKQKNDLIWKKQELNRRISKVDKTMKPIEESPLKDIASPIKRRSSLCRSNSFSCRSSPRRFYAVRRITSSIEETTAEKSTTDENKIENKTNESNVKGILFSNFTNESDIPDLNFMKCDSGVLAENIDDKSEVVKGKIVVNRKKTRRNIFNLRRTSSDSSSTDSVSFDSSEYLTHSSGTFKRRPSSPTNESLHKKARLSINENSETSLCNLQSTSTVDCIHKESENHNVDPGNTKSKFGSENTMDWLTEIEREEDLISPVELTFRDALENVLSRTPAGNEHTQSPGLRTAIDKFTDIPGSIKQSPTIVKAGNESITVSPLLSATSLEFLEKAPILSPVGCTSKSRKRRALNTEYIS